MRVLHVFKTYLPDSFTGIERVIWQIAEGTAQLGVEPEVFSLSKTIRDGSVAIDHHVGHTAKLDLYLASTGLSWSAFGTFTRLIDTVDVVHYHYPWPMMDLLHFWAGRHKPTVVTYHSDIVRQRLLSRLYAPLMHAFLRSADWVVATSPNYLASSLILQRYRHKTSTIPIGLVEASAVPADRLQYWRDRVGERFFLFVGALRYYKGLQFLTEAARQVGLPVVVGGSGDMEEELRAANLTNLHLTGELEEVDKQALLQLCTAFVFPSHLRSEAFGVALLEAARAGKAMISCEMGTGTSYVNHHGETGLSVPPADAAALANAMRQLWNDPQRSAAMGVAARARFERLFTAGAMSRDYVELYHSVVRKRTRQ